MPRRYLLSIDSGGIRGIIPAVALGTGRFKKRKQPRRVGAWLEWVLAELLASPGEQQIEITQRHFPQLIF